jgi:hypothetical protein
VLACSIEFEGRSADGLCKHRTRTLGEGLVKMLGEQNRKMVRDVCCAIFIS